MTDTVASAPRAWQRLIVPVLLVAAIILAGVGEYVLLRQDARGWLFYLGGALCLGLALVSGPTTCAPDSGATSQRGSAISPRAVAVGIVVIGQAVAMVTARSERSLWLPLAAWLISLAALVVVFRRPALSWQRPYWLPKWQLSERRQDGLAIAGLTLLAAAARLINLEYLPNGIHGDEAEFGDLARAVVRGAGPPPFDIAFWGESSFYIHLLAIFVGLFGDDMSSIRWLSALAGLAMTPVVYLLVRDMFGRRPALIAAFLVTASAVHIHFSRMALNIIHGPLFFCVSIWCLWRGFASGGRVWLLMSGVAGGISCLFSFGSRLIVPVLGFILLWRIIVAPRSWATWLREVGLVALGGLIALSPQIAGSWYDRTKLISRTEGRLLWAENNWATAAARHGAETTDVLRIAGGQVMSALSAFTHRRDAEDFFPFDGVSLVPALIAPLAILGLVLAVARMRDMRYAIIVGWFLMPFLIGNVLTMGAGSFHRMLPVVVPALIAAAIFIDAVITAWRRAPLPSAAAIVAGGLTLAVVVAGWQELQTYSRIGSSYPWAAGTFQARYGQSLAPGATLYGTGAPGLYANHGPTRYLADHVQRVDLWNPTASLPLAHQDQPVGIYLSAGSAWLPLLRAYYPQAEVREHQGPPGRTTAYSMTLSPEDLAGGQRPEGGLRGAVGPGETPPALSGGATRIDPSIAFHRLRDLVPSDAFSGQWAGVVTVPKDGDYEFEIATDGQVSLLIDGQPVIDQRDGGLRTVRGALPLTRGEHQLALTGRWERGDGFLELAWRPPGEERTLVPPTALRPASG